MNDNQSGGSPNDAPQGVGLQTETFEFILDTRAGRFFWALTGRPWLVILASVILIAIVLSFLPRLHKDTSAEAFIAADNPAVVYRKHVEEVFGLADPVIVAVASSSDNGIFTASGLKTVASLTDKIRGLAAVDPERVTSLYTESNIIGDIAGISVTPFYDEYLETDEEAAEVRQAVVRFPLYQGSLVAYDGSATLIIAELIDPSKGAEVFHQILAMQDTIDDDSIEVYVAGEGAVAEYLGEYIDADSRRLYPLVGIVIVTILLVAYRSRRGVFIPLWIVVGAATVALGLMAAEDTPMYIITNALPVILIAIGVADGIHIIGAYYEEVSIRPFSQRRQPIVRAMVELWRAVLFTSLTDAAGFIALAAVSDMPPMRAFGIYAALGVVAAAIFSTLVMPAMLAILPVKQSPTFRQRKQVNGKDTYDRYGRIMGKLGAVVIRYPRAVLAMAAVISIAGVVGALQLRVDYARINYFHEDEPIYKADSLINERFDGSNFIDIVLETQETDGLLNAGYLGQIDALQRYAETLPNVGGTTSVVDYVKQLHRALFEDDDEMYSIPEDDGLIAKLFLLFSATGDPESLSKVVDYDYRIANVRIALNGGTYTEIKQVIEPLQQYITENFDDPAMKASIAGRANVTYHWIGALAESHFIGVAVSLLAVWLCAAISFRSAIAGIFAVIPVMFAVLANYAVMGITGIWLGVGTSMFAAIGIGISVNFAIHTLSRTLELVRDYGEEINRAMTQLFPSTGRALFFNFAAVAFGFMVLTTSQISALQEFGFLVAVVTLTSFIASVTILPALLILTKPRFLESKKKDEPSVEDIDIEMGGW